MGLIYTSIGDTAMALKAFEASRDIFLVAVGKDHDATKTVLRSIEECRKGSNLLQRVSPLGVYVYVYMCIRSVNDSGKWNSK